MFVSTSKYVFELIIIKFKLSIEMSPKIGHESLNKRTRVALGYSKASLRRP